MKYKDYLFLETSEQSDFFRSVVEAYVHEDTVYIRSEDVSDTEMIKKRLRSDDPFY